MSQQYTDAVLEKKIEDLRSKIEAWAKSHDLWSDCGFSSWAEHYNDEPPVMPCVLLLLFDGPLYDVFNGTGCDELYAEFSALIDTVPEFCFELENNTTVSFWVEEDGYKELNEAYRDYFEWRWICDLIKPDFSDIYSEIYSRFENSPSDLHRLNSRQFEELLDSIFRNNGYRSELGPGQGDGGVDIRLYASDVIGEAVTLVQVKKYSDKYPIRLEAVQALMAAVDDEHANRGLFVTTSRYYPGVEKFAARQNKRLILATTSDVQKWSSYASKRILRDKSKLVSRSHLEQLITSDIRSGIEGKIFTASTGYTIIDNDFAIVLKETSGAALLMTLPKVIHSHDGYEQKGTHLPKIDLSVVSNLNERLVFRAKKSSNYGELVLWGNRKLYTQWNGKPTIFDFCD